MEAARRDCICVLKPNPKILEQSDRKTMIKHLLMAQRKDQSSRVATVMAKEAGIPPALFKEKSADFRQKHYEKLENEMILLSEEEFEEETLSQTEIEFINQRVLGYREKQNYEPMTEEKMAEMQKKEEQEQLKLRQ